MEWEAINIDGLRNRAHERSSPDLGLSESTQFSFSVYLVHTQ